MKAACGNYHKIKDNLLLWNCDKVQNEISAVGEHGLLGLGPSRRLVFPAISRAQPGSAFAPLGSSKVSSCCSGLCIEGSLAKSSLSARLLACC